MKPGALPALNHSFGILYTLGYAAADATVALEQFMHDYPDALLIDTRLRPSSRWRPVWNRHALHARWGDRYRHEPRLGNVNYHTPGQPILLVNHEEVIHRLADLVRDGQPILLLCACSRYEGCHRKVIADLIQHRVEVIV